MIRVALVDDHDLIRDGLRRNLERDPEIDIVAEAASFAEARAVLSRTRPDIAVIDIRLGDGNGIDLCRELTADGSRTSVVILSMYADDTRIDAARKAGASAFVGKDAPAGELTSTIHAVRAGEQRFPRINTLNADDDRVQLTPRESEVLGLLADGLGVAQISKRLFISESTTKTHVAKIYTKLGATNRAQALMTAIKQGLIVGSEPDF